MRNIVTIARKELQSYFSSPIAYVVIGFFALLFGYFFASLVYWFEQQSLQMTPGSGPPLNINQALIGPVFMNVSVIVLFVMPMITMRTYAEEKRSGTMELLLTSPLTDVQIILGKFLGALGLYAVMLAVTLIHVGVLFIYGSPEWKPIATVYLGLGGALHLEPHEEPDRGRHGHLRGVPAAVGHQLARAVVRPDRPGGDLASLDH